LRADSIVGQNTKRILIEPFGRLKHLSFDHQTLAQTCPMHAELETNSPILPFQPLIHLGHACALVDDDKQKHIQLQYDKHKEVLITQRYGVYEQHHIAHVTLNADVKGRYSRK